jgi:hypothetical protein
LGIYGNDWTFGKFWGFHGSENSGWGYPAITLYSITTQKTMTWLYL